MPGRLRTGSRPSSTVIWDASYAAASELFSGASLRVEVLNALRVGESGPGGKGALSFERSYLLSRLALRRSL
jgi:hypothetical protein